MDFICENCGKTGFGSAGEGPLTAGTPPKGWKWNKSFGFGRKIFCSNRCLDEFNNRNSSKNNDQQNADNHRGANQSNFGATNNPKSGGIISSIFNDDDDERPRTEAEIAADERQRKEAAESDARLFDSIKKLFFRKKNKAAKELHLKLEEIEADIRIAVSKGDKDEAGKLIRQLKHDSTLFVPKTNTSYSKYWAEKREDLLNRL
jgi:hypothetical protein